MPASELNLQKLKDIVGELEWIHNFQLVEVALLIAVAWCVTTKIGKLRSDIKTKNKEQSHNYNDFKEALREIKDTNKEMKDCFVDIAATMKGIREDLKTHGQDDIVKLGGIETGFKALVDELKNK